MYSLQPSLQCQHCFYHFYTFTQNGPSLKGPSLNDKGSINL